MGTESNVIKLTDVDLGFEASNELSLNNPAATNYLENLKKANKLPFTKGEYYYSDDVWDFSPYNLTSIDNHKFRFLFSSVPECFVDVLKDFDLILLLGRTMKIQTITGWNTLLIPFLQYSYDQGCTKVDDITTTIVSGYLDTKRNLSVRSVRTVKNAIKAFFQTYTLNFHNVYSDEMEKLLTSSYSEIRELDAVSKNNKTKNIPDEWLNSFLKALTEVIDDENESQFMKSMSYFYILLSQLGLRIGEMLALRVDSVKTFYDEVSFLWYETWKREDGIKVMSHEYCYLNPVGKAAFDGLLELDKNVREQYNSDYLFMAGNGYSIRGKKEFKITPTIFSQIQRRFYIQLNDRIQTINVSDDRYTDFTRSKVYKKECVKYGLSEDDVLVYPSNHQFRVRVETDLRLSGVQPEYINKFHSHLSSSMKDYHFDPIGDSDVQEDLGFSMDVIKGILSGELTLLGKGSEQITDRIDKFLKANKINVVKDLDTACELLADNLPIRQKAGGVCIRAHKMKDCAWEKPTNEFYCAYGECPCLFHFYYTADITYQKLCDLDKSFKLNVAHSHMLEAEKECHNINRLAKERLKPELDELAKVLESYGKEHIVKKHPEIAYIIDDYDKIMEEVKEWIALNV